MIISTSLLIEPIVEPDLYELAHRLRAEREPHRRPGRPPPPGMMLARLARCARCGATYRLELSGKKLEDGIYKYRYYNCTRACRVGVEACTGGRVRAEALDHLVAEHVADSVCTGSRSEELAREVVRAARTGDSFDISFSVAQVRAEWRRLLVEDETVMRNYALHVLDHVDVGDDVVVVVAKSAYR